MVSLHELKAYCEAHTCVEQSVLAHHFQEDPALLDAMMGYWVRQKCIRRFEEGGGCHQACGSCASSTSRIYYVVLS